MPKRVFLERPQYRIRYRIRYRYRYVISGSNTGHSIPRPPSHDSNEDREMDFDDQRDYMDQDDPAGQFTTVDPGPIHQFLSGIPDWLNFNPDDLDRALESLPIPLKGPNPPRISLQDAIEVKQWHIIHIGHHQTMILHLYRYTISYFDIVQYIVNILYDIGYDIVYDITLVSFCLAGCRQFGTKAWKHNCIVSETLHISATSLRHFI